MRSLLTITALVEGATGLALTVAPASVLSVLLGTSLTDPTALVLSRIAGVTLMAIAVACWLTRNSRQASGMVRLMVGYNVFSLVLLVYLGLVKEISGPGLWPAVLLHMVLLMWCLFSLQERDKKVL